MIKALETPFLIHGGDAVHALKQAQGLLYTMVQSQAAVLSFIDDFWLLATAFIILVPVVFSMRKARREQR